MIRYNWLSLVLALLLFTSCKKEDGLPNPTNPPVSFEEADYRLLFIGNSLTYTNNLPSLVKKLADENGLNIVVRSIAYPNYAIHDHWNDGQVQSEISGKNYDFVIVQQGPSSQSEGRQILIEYGAKYKELCDANGAKLCFFMVWPSLDLYHTFPGVIRNYKDAAEMNQSILCPVGSTWKSYFDSTKNFDYYGPDGFHPSLKGSEVAAEVIYNTLF